MKRLLLLGLVITLFFSSCVQFKYLPVPVDYGAKFSFKPDTTTILLINQFDFNKLKINNKRKLDAIKSGAFTATKYAGNRLTQIPHVRVINLVDSATVSTTADSIKDLAAKYNSDYVLALTNFTADIVLSGTTSSVAYYNSDVLVNFTLFEGNGIYFRKLAGAVNEPQSQGIYLGLFASLVIHPTVGGNKGSINSSAEHATDIAVQDYFPYTLTHNRLLYNDDLLQPAVSEIFAGHYDKAYNLLLPLTQGADAKLASKAAYNLAVVYEAQGDIDIAMNMAQLSLDKNKNRFATMLLADLKAE